MAPHPRRQRGVEGVEEVGGGGEDGGGAGGEEVVQPADEGLDEPGRRERLHDQWGAAIERLLPLPNFRCGNHKSWRDSGLE
jgi:hypothetical protein